MDQIKESINDYLDSKSQYALLINGEWGVGKTYYLQNEIISQNRDDEKVFVYISLYGINDILDIKKKLNFAILSNISKKAKKHENTLSNIGRGGKAFESLITNFLPIGGLSYGIEELFSIIGESQLNRDNKQYVLFVDDLERLGDNVRISDCLGLISTDYMDKLKCKVIFIANEKEIKDEVEFNKIKEKTIDKTLLFKPIPNEILHNLLKESEDNFFIDNVEWVSDIYSFYNETINIRTLKSIITNFIDIVRNINKCEIKKDEFCKIEFQKSLFLNVMVFTEAYKKGSLKSNNINELGSGSRSLNSYNIVEPKKDDETLSQLISNKYHNKMNSEFDNNIFYFGSIGLYIVNAVFEKEEFRKSYDSFLLLISPNPEFDNFERLYNFRRMDDAEILKRQNSILKSVKENKFKIDDLLKIYRQFLEFEKMQLLYIESDFNEVFEEMILQKYMNSEDVSIVDTFFRMNDEDEFEELIMLEKKLTNSLSGRNIKNSKKLVVGIFEANNEIINRYKNTVCEYKIFSSIDDEVMNKYLFAKGNVADRLWKYVKAYYLNHSSIKKIAHEELPFVNNVIEKINDNMEGILEDIDKFKLRQLLDVIEELKEELR